MEKQIDSVEEPEQAGTPRPAKGTSNTMSKRFTVTVLALVLLQIAFFLRNPLSGLFQKAPCHSDLGNLTIEQRAHKILKENPLIDGHNDFLITLRMHYKNHIYGDDFRDKFENGGFVQHVDIPRLKAGMQGGAFWSAFMPCPPGNGTDFSTHRYADTIKSTLEALDTYHRLTPLYPQFFTPTPSSHAAEHAFASNTHISPLIIEGLHQIGNSLSTLRLYHQLGVRYATLTWNCHNAFADAALESNDDFSARIATPYWGGVSKRGRQVVREMNRLGVMVDLAHVSVDTMRDVLVGDGDRDGDEAEWKGSIAPPIFSHSSAHALCPHPRNVPDDILDLVKKRNSIVMVNFSPGFISCRSVGEGELPEFVPENATLAQVVRHIRHIGERIGYEHVGLGTDYDGIESTPAGLEDVSKFPDLVAELLSQGVSDGEVAGVVGRNILRVWREADEVAERLQRTMVPVEDEIGDEWNEKSEL